MKPLVNYCRWQGAKLRLHGRDDNAVWGHIVFSAKDGEEQPVEFRFILANSELTLCQDGENQAYKLDEMGIVL